MASPSERENKLLEAMHAAGASVARTAGDWVELAQSHHVLLEAMRKAFGTRLPTPQKLGLWLSERLGQTADDLILQGQHSARRKQWVYRVASKTKIADELAARAVRVVPSVEIPVQMPAFAAQTPAPAPTELPAPAAPPPGHFMRLGDKPAPEFESETMVDRDGRIKRTLLTGRDGEPIPARPAAGSAPEPKPVKADTQTATPTRIPKILDGTRWRPMTAEEMERHKPHVVDAGHRFMDAGGGFADPGGIVSENYNREQNQGAYVHVCRPMHGKW